MGKSDYKLTKKEKRVVKELLSLPPLSLKERMKMNREMAEHIYGRATIFNARCNAMRKKREMDNYKTRLQYRNPKTIDEWNNFVADEIKRKNGK